MSESPPPTTWAGYARALGVELQRLRIAAGLSQEELAHRAGLTRTHYQQIERGFWTRERPANPSIMTMARLVQALGIEIGDVTPSVQQVVFGD